MSAKSHSAVMLRRNFRHITRNPTSVFNAVLMPIVMMLMFVYVFGDAFDVGVDYIDYATPGLMLLAVCYGLGAVATSVNSDMTKGIINRFKVMDVSRGAVLNGHVIASVVTNAIAITALVGVAFLLGFDPAAGLLDWQRDRARREDGPGCPAVRRVPALHPDHRDPARPAQRRAADR
jgi:ABC-2 type transport system permease protein